MTKIKITESKLKELIRESIQKVFSNGSLNKKYTIKEVKYFHPNGGTLPNGSNYQKGGFLYECRKNVNSFVLDEGVHGEQYGLSKYRGGMIVFAVNVNAVKLSNNKIINSLKQFIETTKNSFNKDKIVHGAIIDFNNDKTRNSGEYIGAYSLGNFFKGKYVGDNGEMFNDKSICLEINGLSSKSLLKLAEMIADRFKQETVLVKDLNKNKIYLADSNEYDDSFDSDLDNINKECVHSENNEDNNIVETTRRQKAQQAIQSKNRKIKTIVIISAQNPMGNVSIEEYNKDAHNDLLKSLKIGQFRYFETNGLYGSPEKSVLVYNISLDDTLFLCYKYSQESVIFIDMTDDNQISYQYWEGDKHNTPLKLQHEENEIVGTTNEKDYYTKILNKFKFRIPFFEDIQRYNTELIECSKHNDVDYLIEIILSDKKTRYSKYMHRGKLNSLLKKI